MAVLGRAEQQNLLVTVGTTKFDALIETILEENVMQALVNAGYCHWRLQIGAASESLKARLQALGPTTSITIQIYDYKPSLESDIEWAHLVIGHAGAGTILDVLRGPISGKGRRERPALLIVRNDSLMGGHQAELTEALHEAGVCACCSIGELREDPEGLIQEAAVTCKATSLPEPNTAAFNAQLRDLLSG